MLWLHATMDSILWEAMRQVWSLPHDQLLINSGREWLPNLLLNCNEDERDRVLMLLWRIWHLWNDFTHGKEVSPVATTADYLDSYIKSIGHPCKYSTEEIIKGKMPVADLVLPKEMIVQVSRP